VREDVYRVLVRRPEEKRPPGGCRRRWEDKIVKWMLGKLVGEGEMWTGSSGVG